MYEVLTNERINMSKFKIFFPRNTSRSVRRDICNMFRRVFFFQLFRRISKSHLNGLVQHMLYNSGSRQGMMLSQAGRIMFTNLILNSILLHPFSITWMSNFILDRVIKVARRFLWGNSGSLHYLHLLPWETVMPP